MAKHCAKISADEGNITEFSRRFPRTIHEKYSIKFYCLNNNKKIKVDTVKLNGFWNSEVKVNESGND